MKKTQGSNLDFDMINLDETAGWNQLEVEAALSEQKPEIEYFDEEDEYHDPVAATYEKAEEIDYFDEEDEDLVCVNESDAKQEATLTSEAEAAAIFSADEYVENVAGKGTLEQNASEKVRTSSKTREYKENENYETIWDKVIAVLKDMTALDGIVAVTGVLVLVVAIVTVSVFSGAKIAQEQVAAFAPIGEEMEYLTDAGKGTLLAMADSKKIIEEEEEPTYEYDEKDLVIANINVNMKLTSVHKDLKITTII